MGKKEKQLKKTIQSGILSDDRRDFLYKTGLLSVATTFGLSFFTACSNSEDMQPNTSGNNNSNDDDSAGNDDDSDDGGNSNDDGSTGNDDDSSDGDDTDNGDDTNDGDGSGNGDTDDDGITVDGNQVIIDLTIQTSLNTVGGWLLITEAQVLVVKIGENDFNALTSVCTHRGCDTNWSYQNNIFTCGCHGSQFSQDGNVQSGPAQSGLQNYSAQLSGNQLTISK